MSKNTRGEGRRARGVKDEGESEQIDGVKDVGFVQPIGEREVVETTMGNRLLSSYPTGYSRTPVSTSMMQMCNEDQVAQHICLKYLAHPHQSGRGSMDGCHATLHSGNKRSVQLPIMPITPITSCHYYCYCQLGCTGSVGI